MGDRILSAKKTGRDLPHTVLYVKLHIVSGPLSAKNALFFLGLRAHAAVSQCHSVTSGDMCIPVHISPLR